jgi:ABC-type transport system substrate-binding protein
MLRVPSPQRSELLELRGSSGGLRPVAGGKDRRGTARCKPPRHAGPHAAVAASRDVGRSFTSQDPVAASIAAALPVTLELAGWAIVLAVLAATLLNSLPSAPRWLDKLIVLANLIGITTSEGLWWFNANAKSYPYDPAKAKALLAEAGHPSGFEYTLSTPQVGVFQQINQLAQEQLASIGIKLKLEPVAQSEWYDRVVKRTTNFTPTRWTQRPDPDGLLYILFHSKGFANTTG